MGRSKSSSLHLDSKTSVIKNTISVLEIYQEKQMLIMERLLYF